MTVLRLKYFLAVSQSGSFSEAAEILYTTQSSVSKQIIALEKELSAELFDRSHRKIALTPQGMVVLAHAQHILEEHAEMVKELAAFGLYDGQALSVASIPVMAHYNVPTLLASFREQCPSIRIELDEREGNDILFAMEQRQCELAFMRSDKLDCKLYEWQQLCEDRVVAVLPAGHPLASAAVLSLRHLRPEKFLLLNRNTLIYQLCVNACNEAGFQPNIVYTGTRSENIMEMVASGMGISLMMEQSARYVGARDVALVPLAEALTSTFSLVRMRRGHYTSAALALWNFVAHQK